MSLLLSIDNFSSEDFDFQILKMFISGVKYLINEREQRGRNRQSGISSSFIDKKKSGVLGDAIFLPVPNSGEDGNSRGLSPE